MSSKSWLRPKVAVPVGLGALVLALAPLYVGKKETPRVKTHSVAEHQSEEQHIAPYETIVPNENALVTICGFNHGGFGSLASEKDKADFILHAKRVVETLKEVRSTGIETILVEGLHDEEVQYMKKNPNARVAARGSQQIFMQIVFGYLMHSDWNIQGYEVREIQKELDIYTKHIRDINQRWVRELTGELQRQKILVVNESGRILFYDKERAKPVQQKYSELMQAEVRAFLEEPTGDRIFELAFEKRDNYAGQKIKELITEGKRVAVLVGGRHAATLHVTLSDIPHKIISDKPLSGMPEKEPFLEETYVPGDYFLDVHE